MPWDSNITVIVCSQGGPELSASEGNSDAASATLGHPPAAFVDQARARAHKQGGL